MPLAEQHLTQDDWTELAAVLRESRAPMLGDAPRDVPALFHTIVNLMPPSFGPGGRWAHYYDLAVFRQ